ncbi:hypothetical protein AMTRI_Chr03g141860 [Amborella trichopoda]
MHFLYPSPWFSYDWCMISLHHHLEGQRGEQPNPHHPDQRRPHPHQGHPLPPLECSPHPVSPPHPRSASFGSRKEVFLLRSIRCSSNEHIAPLGSAQSLPRLLKTKSWVSCHSYAADFQEEPTPTITLPYLKCSHPQMGDHIGGDPHHCSPPLW